jgi:hypothetical protein
MPSYRIDDYYGNPDRTRDGFKKAAETVVKALLDDMQDKVGPVGK